MNEPFGVEDKRKRRLGDDFEAVMFVM